jgi:hypothetical protein
MGVVTFPDCLCCGGPCSCAPATLYAKFNIPCLGLSNVTITVTRQSTHSVAGCCDYTSSPDTSPTFRITCPSDSTYYFDAYVTLLMCNRPGGKQIVYGVNILTAYTGDVIASVPSFYFVEIPCNDPIDVTYNMWRGSAAYCSCPIFVDIGTVEVME